MLSQWLPQKSPGTELTQGHWISVIVGNCIYVFNNIHPFHLIDLVLSAPSFSAHISSISTPKTASSNNVMPFSFYCPPQPKRAPSRANSLGLSAPPSHTPQRSGVIIKESPPQLWGPTLNSTAFLPPGPISLAASSTPAPNFGPGFWRTLNYWAMSENETLENNDGGMLAVLRATVGLGF